jgi:hypothetical protein
MSQALYNHPSRSESRQGGCTRPDRPATQIAGRTIEAGQEMRVGLAMVFALIAVGFGYVVFARTAVGIFWDAGFLIFSVAFLVAFISAIWRFAVLQIQRAEHRSGDDSP